MKIATDAELHVSYAHAPTNLADQWRDALQGAGYTVETTGGLPQMLALEARKGDQRFELLITHAGSRADVLLTRPTTP